MILSNTLINFEIENQIFIKIKGGINILSFKADYLIFEKGIFFQINNNNENYINSINFTNLRIQNSIINNFLESRNKKYIVFSHFAFFNVQSSFKILIKIKKLFKDKCFIYLHTVLSIQFIDISILNSNFKNFGGIFESKKIFLNKILIFLSFLSDSLFYLENCHKKYVNNLNVSYLIGDNLPLALFIQNIDSKAISLVNIN